MDFPIHPQWFTRKEKKLLNLLQSIDENKTVLDIGCADMWTRNHLASSTTYLGLDYPLTANNLYRCRPSLYGSAELLPFEPSSIDHVLMLDVLEHLARPRKALLEIASVLKADGTAIVRIPFLYPIHDAPHDYTRFTEFGLKEHCDEAGLEISELHKIGTPLETSALLRNIALGVTILNLYKNRNPLALFAIFLPLYFLINNLYSHFLSKVISNFSLMPHTYLLVLTKTIKHESNQA